MKPGNPAKKPAAKTAKKPAAKTAKKPGKPAKKPAAKPGPRAGRDINEAGPATQAAVSVSSGFAISTVFDGSGKTETALKYSFSDPGAGDRIGTLSITRPDAARREVPVTRDNLAQALALVNLQRRGALDSRPVFIGQAAQPRLLLLRLHE